MINTSKLKQWDFVLVEWEDIVGHGPQWEVFDDSSSEERPAPCGTPGYVLRGWSPRAKDMLIAGSQTEGTVSDKTTFPKGCIHKIWIIFRKAEDWVWLPVEPMITIVGNP